MAAVAVRPRDLVHTVLDEEDLGGTYVLCWACMLMLLADAERRGDRLTISVGPAVAAP